MGTGVAERQSVWDVLQNLKVKSSSTFSLPEYLKHGEKNHVII
jgi:hypothetical protein